MKSYFSQVHYKITFTLAVPYEAPENPGLSSIQAMARPMRAHEIFPGEGKATRTDFIRRMLEVGEVIARHFLV